MRVKEFKEGMCDGIPIALGYVSVSFTFGLMAVGAGMSWWQALLISMTCLTSAGQFAGLEIMVMGGALIEMALSQLVINLRYALMSLSLSQKVDTSLNTVWRFGTGAGITDEIFAVAMNRKGKVSRNYLCGLIAIPYLGWAIGTVAGALLGSVLPTIVGDAMGIAIYGMFLAIIIPKARENKRFLIVILLAAGLSCAFKWLPGLSRVSSGFVVIICAIIASAFGAIFYPIPLDSDMEQMEKDEHVYKKEGVE